MGLRIFDNMVPTVPDTWEGALYNPEDGNIYSGTLTIVDANTLELEGCLIIIIIPICQSDTWTRVIE